MADEDMSGEVVPYRPVIDAVVIDCADPARLAQFWQALLGGDLHTQPDGVTELHGGRIRLDFARVPEPKQTKNRLHLDLHVPPESKDQAIAHALNLGATPAPDIYDGPLWQTLRDPEGHEFCLVWGATE